MRSKLYCLLTQQCTSVTFIVAALPSAGEKEPYRLNVSLLTFIYQTKGSKMLQTHTKWIVSCKQYIQANYEKDVTIVVDGNALR